MRVPPDRHAVGRPGSREWDQNSCSQNLTVVSLGDKNPFDTLVIPTTDESEDPPPWASAISEELPSGPRRRKKVKDYCINSEDDANPISPSAATRQKITKAVTPGHRQYLTTNLQIPTQIPSRFAQIPMRLSTISIIFPYLLPSSYVVSDNISVSSGVLLASSTFDT